MNKTRHTTCLTLVVLILLNWNDQDWIFVHLLIFCCVLVLSSRHL